MLYKFYRRHLASIALCLVFFLPRIAIAAVDKSPQEQHIINIGVLATEGRIKTIRKWHPLMRWLEEQVPGYYFRLSPLNLEQLSQAVAQDSLDFIITNSQQSVILSHQYKVTWLATLKNKLHLGSTTTTGSVFIVNANSTFQTLPQLYNKKIAAVSEQAFGGYLAFLYEMKQQNVDTQQLFSHVTYTGFPLDNLVNQLLDGDVDGAIVPVCHLEKMTGSANIALTNFRVLNNKTPTEFGCLTSTELYANFSFSKTKNVSPQLAKQVTLALLALAEEHPAALAANSRGWGTAASKLQIDNVLQALNIHPLQTTLLQKTTHWLIENRLWASFWVITFILLNFYHFLLEYKFSKSKRLLTNAQQQLNEKQSMLEHTQRIAIVGELGSSIAHDINQPLSAIRSYSEGALRRIARGASNDELSPILKKIIAQVVRTDAIISRLRQLIKKRVIEKRKCEIEPIVHETFALLTHYSVFFNANIKVEGTRRELYIDPIGMAQLLLNIIKNAIESCADISTTLDHYIAKIEVEISYKSNHVSILISDNGAGFVGEAKSLQSPFISTKKDGLGLGLAICREVIESHLGSLTMTNIEPHGCMIEITVPYQQKITGVSA